MFPGACTVILELLPGEIDPEEGFTRMLTSEDSAFQLKSPLDADVFVKVTVQTVGCPVPD
jgi:hypothetical protein